MAKNRRTGVNQRFKVREASRMQGTALVVTMAVRDDGRREITGLSL
ncbi:MAG: hypothetical protein ACOX4G_03095 [Limnochordia bacterium]|jgi:transposase-like protein